MLDYDNNFFEIPADLKPRTHYDVEITVVGKEEAKGTTFFETGKMDEAWTAKWIANDNKDLQNTLFKKNFSLKDNIKSARLYITGLGLYEAYLNNEKIGDEYLTPGSTAYDKWVEVQTYDVTKQLKENNEILISTGDGWYYLLVAEGGTGEGHMITIFRSKELWGSYESDPDNPIFTNRDRANEAIQNVGHGDLFTDPDGNWWLVCLGTRPASVGFKQITNLGRETLLYPVEWENGWPVINNGVPTEKVDLTDFPQHAATLSHEQKINNFVDDFSEDKLRPEWLTLRNDLGENLAIANDSLVLKGNELTISDLSTASFVGLRQTEHEETLEVKLNSEKSQLNDGSFGIASLIDAENHAALMIQKSENGFDVYRDQQIADIKLNEKIGHLDKTPTSFKLVNTKETKVFSVSDGEKEVSFTTDAIHLSNQAIAALNTGDIEGLYARNEAVMAIDEVRR